MKGFPCIWGWNVSSDHHLIESKQTISSFERLSCFYGNWDTFGFTVHMSDDQEILIENIPSVLKQLLTAHPRMRPRIRIDYRHPPYRRIRRETALLETYSANDSFLNNDELLKQYYSIHYTDDNENEWKRLCTEGCNRNPYIDEQLTIIFPLFQFLFLLNGRSACTIINDYLTLATTNNKKLNIGSVQQPFLADITPKLWLFNIYFWMKIFSDYSFKKEEKKSTFPIKEPCSSNNTNNYPYYFLPSESKFIFQSDTKESYQALKQICQSKQLTIHGPLHACLLLTIQHQFLLRSSDDEFIETFPVGVPCDLRKHLQLPKSIAGYYASSATVNMGRFPLRPTKFWSFATQCIVHRIHGADLAAIYRTRTCIGLQCAEQMNVTLMHEFMNDDTATAFLKNYVKIMERCSVR
ncbi:unnamed protein product [Didymodactylos carnosus]|uniref:Uncharacterized protein n=1 Tax=Didymodactylos carnosus TaxID=1234261 RepID=A0A814XD98_9BILA|nr:unnamed protein product [Didymodactylos carnosus]CAF3973753.1 unnamed protein product [Didymodactylos carnosus]